MVHALVKIAIDPTICHIARRGMTMPPASISLHLPGEGFNDRLRKAADGRRPKGVRPVERISSYKFDPSQRHEGKPRVIREPSQLRTASQINQWLSSPKLKPPPVVSPPRPRSPPCARYAVPPPLRNGPFPTKSISLGVPPMRWAQRPRRIPLSRRGRAPPLTCQTRWCRDRCCR
jgi:hypothetical protein